jgi:hypothetical protein
MEGSFDATGPEHGIKHREPERIDIPLHTLPHIWIVHAAGCGGELDNLLGLEFRKRVSLGHGDSVHFDWGFYSGEPYSFT